MKKIFLDADVLLDLLLDRAPFVEDIVEIVETSLSSKVRLCVSPITITNIHYIINSDDNSNNKSTALSTKAELLHICF